MNERDIPYQAGEIRMLGWLCAPSLPATAPSLVIVPDAFGIANEVRSWARELAGLGIAVLVADLWGDRASPDDEDGIGPRIAELLADREHWIRRVAAAQSALATETGADAADIAMLGFCLGGSSVLEHLRVGGRARGVVSIHGGLDLLGEDWTSAGRTRVLLCSGAADPMATSLHREDLQRAMSEAGIDWETDLYSDTKHAFTNPRSRATSMPEVVDYHPRNAARARAATHRFLIEIFPRLQPAG